MIMYSYKRAEMREELSALFHFALVWKKFSLTRVKSADMGIFKY